MFNIFNPEQGASYDKEGKKIDEVSATEPATVSEPTTTTQPPATDPAPTAPSATQEVNWEERTGGAYKSWEEIEAKLKEKPTVTEFSFANDQSKTVAEYLKEGKLDDVWQVLNDQRRLANADKMSDAEALKLHWEFKNTHFSSEDIESEFKDKYVAEKPEPLGELDDYEDEETFNAAKKIYDKEFRQYEKEQKRLDRLLKTDALAAKEELRSLKSDIVLPDITPAAAAQSQEPVQPDLGYTQEQLDAARNSYLSELTKSAGDFKAIPFKLSDEGVAVDVSHVIDPKEIVALQKDLTEKNVLEDVIGSRYVKGDGYDTKQLIEDIYFLNNKDKIISNLVKQAIAQDRKKDLADRKNINLNGGQQSDFTPSKETEYKEFAKSFFSQG